MTIVPIVEGVGEGDAVPLLIRRIARDAGRFDVVVPKPVRVPRTKLVTAGRLNESELRRAVTLAKVKLGDSAEGAIFIIADADDDCPVELAAAVIRVARPLIASLGLGVVFTNREFEAWFLAAIESLRAVRGVHVDASVDRNPDSIRGAKEAIKRLRSPAIYSPTVDQPAFVSAMDLAQARQKSRSFCHCWSQIMQLLSQHE